MNGLYTSPPTHTQSAAEARVVAVQMATERAQENPIPMSYRRNTAMPQPQIIMPAQPSPDEGNPASAASRTPPPQYPKPSGKVLGPPVLPRDPALLVRQHTPSALHLLPLHLTIRTACLCLVNGLLGLIFLQSSTPYIAATRMWQCGGKHSCHSSLPSSPLLQSPSPGGGSPIVARHIREGSTGSGGGSQGHGSLPRGTTTAGVAMETELESSPSKW